MRYIFFAAFCTLAVISSMLALPAFGEPHSRLVEQSYGDRLALAAGTTSVINGSSMPATTGARAFTAPAAASNSVLQLASTDELDRTDEAPSAPRGDRALSSINVEVAPRVETVDATTTSAEPATTTTASTTTTTSAPTTTSSTTAPTTTTTTAPATTIASGPLDASITGGVVISDTGVVLPVIAASEAGVRATTPCGNEVTLTSGTHVASADVVLDAGHGGNETGAVSPDGQAEKNLNLRIASIVEWYLEEAGYTVVQTRTSDIRIPLLTRAETAIALDPRAFVSIHHNGGATRPQNTPGSEVFVDGGNPEARRLGGLIFEEMMDRMSRFDADWVGSIRHGVSTRLNDDGADLYGLHRFTPGIPSVITEVGYLTNPSEAAVYVDNDAQWAHGRAIADGIIRWMNSSDPGRGYIEDFVDASSSGTGGFNGCVDPAL